MIQEDEKSKLYQKYKVTSAGADCVLPNLQGPKAQELKKSRLSVRWGKDQEIKNEI